MDTAYLHIVTNHIPVIGVPLAVFLLGLGIWRKSDDLKVASFLILSFLGIATLTTFLLGQGGEDFVEDLAGVSHDSISEHEDFAKIALGSVAITAIVSLFAVLRYQGLSFFRRKITASKRLIEGEVSTVTGSRFPAWITISVLIFSLLSGGLLGYTGKLGGKIRHTEFYGNAPSEKDEDHGEEKENKADTKNEILPAEKSAVRTDEKPVEDGKKRKRRGKDKD